LGREKSCEIFEKVLKSEKEKKRLGITVSKYMDEIFSGFVKYSLKAFTKIE